MVEKCKMKVLDITKEPGMRIAYDMECLTHGEKIRVYGRKLRKCNCFFDESVREQIDAITKRQNKNAVYTEGVKDE